MNLEVRKLKIFFVIIVAVYLTGCTTSYSKLVRVEKPWIIEGRVLAQADGKPVSAQIVELGRMEKRGALGMFGGDFPFVFVKTDADGKFFISSAIAGYYTITANCPNVFGGLYESLGELRTDQHINRDFIFHPCLNVQ